MEVAASIVRNFPSENTATPPKHIRVPVSKGNSSSGCSVEAFLVALLWSNHLRTFGFRRWRSLYGRLNRAAGMYCTLSTSWFSATLIRSVFNSSEDMEYFPPALRTRASTSWAAQAVLQAAATLQNATSSLCDPLLGHHLCATNILQAVPLAGVDPAVPAGTGQYLAQASLGTLSSSSPRNPRSCRAAAAVAEGAKTMCAVTSYACRYIVTIWLVGKLLCIFCRSQRGFRRQGAATRGSLHLFVVVVVVLQLWNLRMGFC